MKRLLLLALLLLPACASTGGSPGFGYQEKQISELRYRIAYTDRSSDLSLTMDAALLRAAILTLREGYDWFDVPARQSGYIDGKSGSWTAKGYGPDSMVRRDCGFNVCSSRIYLIAADPVGSRSSRPAEAYSVIEIRLGKGVRPASPDAYDARQIIEALG